MIKNTLAVAFIFLLNTYVIAQGEANNWFFGDGAGLVFDNINGTVTPTAAASQTINTLEGCSSISDPNGNLKFYTDGRDVWDANHNIMPNANYFAGTGLLGDPSSTSSGVIIPKPGDLDKYYIFTVDEPHHQNAWAFPNQGPAEINGNPTEEYSDSFTSVPGGDDGYNNGLNYSLVDMTLNNGMGDIDSSEKNIQLQTYDPLIQEHLEYKCSEKITAVEHTDGQSNWVLTHFVDTFYAFRIDSNGVNHTPVTSTVTPSINVSGYRRNSIGYLKSSPDGTRLAISHNQNSNNEGSNIGNGSAWLYDFDKETGLVSNPLQLASNANFYGVAFSQNSEKVYFSSSVNGVQQFDLTSVDIPNSATTIYQQPFATMGGMQLGPDGKIYVCNLFYGNSLDVINAPNESGALADYVEAGQQLSLGTRAQFGLPPFIQSFLVANISYVNDCLGSNTEFSLSTSETIVSLEWDFGDSKTSTELKPTHVYTLPGKYTVSVTITTTTKVQTFYTLVNIFDTPTANAVEDINGCDDDNDGIYSFDFNSEVTPDVLGTQDAADFSISYHASQQDAEDNANPYPNPYTNTLTQETVFVRIENVDNPDCFDTTSFEIEVFDTPVIAAINDLPNCDEHEDGYGLFDLTELDAEITGTLSNLIISYHETEAEALNNMNAIVGEYSNVVPYQQTIYVRVTNDLTDCYTVLNFDLILNPIPNAVAIDDFIACELNTDDVFDFDLETQSSLILGGQDPTLFEVTYHTSLADATLGTNFLDSPYTNISDPQTIYVRVKNTNTGCINTTVQFNLAVHEAALASSPLTAYSLCDDNVETDGDSTNDSVQFDLSTQNDFILSGQDPLNYTVRYYASQSDADQAINELPTLFENSVNPQQVIARVDIDTQIIDASGALIDSSTCYDTAEVILEVNPLPIVEIKEEYILCFDLNGTDLVIDTALSDQDYTFVWTDASGKIVGTNSSYAPLQGGTYTLKVNDETLSTKCAAPIETFTVIESSLPIVTAQVTTAAFANTHIIEAVATGQGQYEYRLDQGPWGDSGTFMDVTPGEHLVTVRDINGCGEGKAFVYVIDYPKYFTPNGDDYHDRWNITAISNQVNAKIYIFDRFGKLIKEIRPSGTGWDGTYNGVPLPASDYWFTLQYIDPITANPKQLKSHFTLKR